MASDEVELKSLLMAGLAGDDAAHRRFLSAVAALLRGYFRNRLRGSDDIEDLVQESLIAIHTKRSTYDPSYPVTAWLYAIGRYRLIDHVRKLKRRGISAQLEDVDGELAVAPEAEAGVAKRDLNRLLERLPAKQRDVIRLTKLEDASVREAAQRTGLSESDVKVSVHRGLKTLMRMMAEEAP